MNKVSKETHAVSVTALHQNPWTDFNAKTKELAIATVVRNSGLITVYAKILASDRTRTDLIDKTASLVAVRLETAEWLVSNGVRMRKIGEYRRAAEGTSLETVLSEKVETGAILGNSEDAPFTIEPGHAMACLIGGSPDRIADAYLIEPSTAHPGFFFLSHLSDGCTRVDYLTRPIRSDFVPNWLKAEGLADPAAAQWRAHPCAGVEKAGQSLHPALEAA